ncbi:MAG: Leucine--tRNA ligase [Acidimicrobiales bacterium]|nr:Leucine--tRNA ligase [Acidimicrobiales bacterium]
MTGSAGPERNDTTPDARRRDHRALEAVGRPGCCPRYDSGMAETGTAREELPPHRYTAALANEIETRWQQYWEQHATFHTPNPVGDLSEGFERFSDHPKLFVMDMFPYPSGAGLHVGHPLGYIGTDVYCRFKRMTGHNVLHTLGYDAFGLPAEEYARQTGTHPRATTEANIANMRRQLRALGLGHDSRRSIATTDPSYYRWTQWIFLKIFGSWYDAEQGRARPIADLVEELESGARQPAGERAWAELDGTERRLLVDSHRLAYLDEAPVNWCPGLGTVLANEEVTADGRSERGNHPVYRRPLKQWMMRITAYAERLLDDLDLLDWPEPIKIMQRNWIGRSEGANVDFPAGDSVIEVFTTRPDTLFGATYMVLAPEHPLVSELTAAAWPDGTPEAWTGGYGTPLAAVQAYQGEASSKSEVERQVEAREKTGVFTGSYAINPTNDEEIPVFIADYVLMGYGTGAIMAVPGQDERDFEFARELGLPIIRTVQPPDGWGDAPYTGEGPAINSSFLDGLGVDDAKREIIGWLEANGKGRRSVTYKLRDWLFSRQRYWGEPFPIVYDETGLPIAVPEEHLPIELPDVDDYLPAVSEDEEAVPEPPLARATGWVEVTLDLGDGPKQYRRELDTMPQWAGSCWYHLRYIDPTDDEHLVEPENDRYWMTDEGVDLYVGGVEHAVLHLLYSRFWQKVLFDLGHVSSCEPYHRLFNQGYIQAAAYKDERGLYVDAQEVVESDGEFTYQARPVTREFGKMGKSLKNSVTPDEMYEEYGADTLRLYEMFMGPLDQDRPWDTTAIVGSHRLIQRLWRNLVDEVDGEVTVTDAEPDEETLRVLHRTIEGVRADMDGLRFNTAIAKITELNNHLTKAHGATGVPLLVAEPLVLMVAPLAPHVAEELWRRMGHTGSLAYEAFPEADPARLVEETVTMVVQVNGKVRDRVAVPADIDEEGATRLALASDKVQKYLDGAEPRTVIARPPKLVNVVA